MICRLLRQLRQAGVEYRQQGSSDLLWPLRRCREARVALARLRPTLDETSQRFLRISQRRSWMWRSVAGFACMVAVSLLTAAFWLHSNNLTLRHGTAMALSTLGVYPVDEPEMVDIPGGEFWMGSHGDDSEAYNNEKPRRRVTLAPFAIGRYEVTFAEYDQFAYATGRPLVSDQGWGRGQRPVINVSWEDAMAYTEWLSAQTGKDYQLPTEAEWEYAARAGTESARFWGDDPDQACEHANVGDSSTLTRYSAEVHNCDDGYVETAPVGSFQANPWKLYDMLGNVWEWTCSEYRNPYDGAENLPCNVSNIYANDGAARVLRGGSWLLPAAPRAVRSPVTGLAPAVRLNILGFRLARSK